MTSVVLHFFRETLNGVYLPNGASRAGIAYLITYKRRIGLQDFVPDLFYDIQKNILTRRKERPLVVFLFIEIQ